MDIIKSKNGIPIRLTAERWLHIMLENGILLRYKGDELVGLTIIYRKKRL